MGCNWNRNVMQKKRQLMMEESSQKELDTLKGSISSEAQELRMQKENAEQAQAIEKDSYAEKLSKVEDNINKIQSSLCRMQTRKTLEEKLEALAELRKLQESQEFNAKKEEQALAEKSAKQQEEINENNSELLMVLECIEKMEEEDESEDDKKKTDENPEAIELWEWIREISLKEFDKVYDMLNIKFDSMLEKVFIQIKCQRLSMNLMRKI